MNDAAVSTAGLVLVLGTIYAAVILYFAALALKIRASLASPSRADPGLGFRITWSLAALIFALHVLAAVHFYHGWSLASVVASTEASTREILGVPLGQGVFFSFLFGALWLADGTWALVHPASYHGRSRLLDRLVHLYLLFIVLNGLLVFEGWFARLVGLLGLGLLAGVWFTGRKEKSPGVGEREGPPSREQGA